MTTSGSIFDNCDDSCGWVAAIVAALAYGSFGLPIKETVHLDVHPLVFQSYKTGTMFLTCWLVLLMGVPVMWTPWGLLSGLLWVLGGCGGVYAIRMAGMALAVGTWASVMIMINFFWGILVFQEPVHDVFGTMGAFLLLTLGLIGMSVYSTPSSPEDDSSLSTSDEASDVMMDGSDSEPVLPKVTERNVEMKRGRFTADQVSRDVDYYSDMEDSENPLVVDDTVRREPDGSKPIVLFGTKLSKRSAGILGAVFNGLMTGSSLIPLHYAKQEGFGGARYMISFATGALIANSIVWMIFFAFLYTRNSAAEISGSVLWQTYSSLPMWHFEQLWLPGFAAGLLLTVAMFGSILATTYLGQGIGNSVVQSKILISGLWGICWYGEIAGRGRIAKWFLSASLTVSGILWLSHERMTASHGGGDHRELSSHSCF